MDPRYQVFVSSTYLDLRVERQSVIQALLQLDAIPAGMELFPAADDDAWTVIQRVIGESDYYLLVIGGKYGSQDEAGLSYTEKEYDYALSRKQPVMAFLHADPDAIPFGKSEADTEARRKLDAFRRKVEASKHVKYWQSAEELAGQVALSYSWMVKNHPAVGWVRGDQMPSAETMAELAALRDRTAELEAALSRTRNDPPPGTEDLAQGDEAADFSLIFTIHRIGISPYSHGIPAKQRVESTVAATWDGIFRAVGPLMLDEAEQEDIEDSLARWALGKHYDQLVDDARGLTESQADEAGVELPHHKLRLSDPAVNEDDFGTILVQLKALGLIDKSTRQRSVKDRGVYWCLTAFGETRLVSLRALRRGEDVGSSRPADHDTRDSP